MCTTSGLTKNGFDGAPARVDGPKVISRPKELHQNKLKVFCSEVTKSRSK
jgi:hypothetical protein